MRAFGSDLKPTEANMGPPGGILWPSNVNLEQLRALRECWGLLRVNFGLPKATSKATLIPLSPASGIPRLNWGFLRATSCLQTSIQGLPRAFWGTQRVLGPPEGDFGPPKGSSGHTKGSFEPPGGNVGPSEGHLEPFKGNFGTLWNNCRLSTQKAGP